MPGAGRRLVITLTGVVAIVGTAARASVTPAAGGVAGVAVGGALIRITNLLCLANAGASHEVGRRAADQPVVTRRLRAGDADASLSCTGNWRRCGAQRIAPNRRRRARPRSTRGGIGVVGAAEEGSVATGV